MLNVKLFPAEYGDSIWIKYASDLNINILIDGGTKKTCQKFIKPELIKIKKLGQKIDLMICTHIDYDHIGGLVQMLNNMKSRDIETVWYNGFLQIINSKYYNRKDNRFIEEDNKILDDLINEGTIYEGEQEVAINEGIAFETLLEDKKISINTVTDGMAIITENIQETIKLSDNIKITILGPSIKRIKDLESCWTREMVSRNYTFNVTNKIRLIKAFEYLMEKIKYFYPKEQLKVSCDEGLEKYLGNLNETDCSVTNGSSISFILHYKKEKYLFLGDAIIDGELLENIEKTVGYKYRFSAIKLPHHGSRYNITNEFINRYKANEYYCLTNGQRYGHPDLEVIASIICKDSDFKTIIFNYPVEKILFLDNPQMKKRYNYEVIIGDGCIPIERIFK